jgi:glutamate carboxypeptidase
MDHFVSMPVDHGAILGDIERLTRIESPSCSAQGVNRVLDAIEALFQGSDAALERSSPNARYGDLLCVRCDPERREPGILVLSHVDTVHPPGTIDAALPYRREGDRAYGPGIYDMKGGLVLAIAAYQRLARAGVPRPLPLTFLFTPDEEVGSPVSRPHIEALALANRYALVTEPKRNGGKIVTRRKGTGQFEIRLRGRPAHAGASHAKGRSAIRAMAELVRRIEGFTDYARGITTNVGTIHGGSAVNVIPEHCTIEVDLRAPDLATAAEMEDRFARLAADVPDITLTITGGMNRPPFVCDAAVEALFAEAAGVASKIGVRLESDALSGGGSDGNFTAAQGIATLDGLGIDGDGAHTHHEHILVSSIEPGTRLLQGLFETLGGKRGAHQN